MIEKNNPPQFVYKAESGSVLGDMGPSNDFQSSSPKIR
jgi:hypothetical protein